MTGAKQWPERALKAEAEAKKLRENAAYNVAQVVSLQDENEKLREDRDSWKTHAEAVEKNLHRNAAENERLRGYVKRNIELRAQTTTLERQLTLTWQEVEKLREEKLANFEAWQGEIREVDRLREEAAFRDEQAKDLYRQRNVLQNRVNELESEAYSLREQLWGDDV